MLFLAAFILASVAYWFLQDLEDRKAERAGLARPGTARRAALWFFLCIGALVLLHLAGVGGGAARGASGGGAAGGGAGGAEGGAAGPAPRGTLAYDPTEMLRRIPEDVQVGARTPF